MCGGAARSLPQTVKRLSQRVFTKIGRVCIVEFHLTLTGLESVVARIGKKHTVPCERDPPQSDVYDQSPIAIRDRVYPESVIRSVSLVLVSR
ncbi:hypothetical protein AA103196_2797 [Ameyamaea chiangmaiensis NBRC 103196]|nr:hypothetical protein AA103196_2797 [Ameyamaea chiangmaiensis NBRC 103196]